MRRRVLLLVGATTSLVLIAFLLPLALLIRDVAADRAVQAATVRAQSLSALVATTDGEARALSVAQVDPTATVFLADGTRLGVPAERTSLVELAFRGASESSDVPGGREIVFAVGGPTGTIAVIRAFVPDARLSDGVGRAWLLLAGLGVVLLGVSLVVADRLARSLVRATISLAAVSHRLARGELDARADPAAPGEIGVVATALNGLAARIADLLREERETIADLSHRVRTPLMALRLDAEALDRPDDAERIGTGVDAVQRAVTLVIEQARRRGDDPAGVAFWLVLAEDTDREVGVDVPGGPLPVAVPRADLEAGVDALLGNVFAHTPDGTGFRVALEARPEGGARLVVADAGPGMDAAAVRRGSSGSGSSGLGLDIARRMAEASGGGLRIGASEHGGLLVTVDLGSRA